MRASQFSGNSPPRIRISPKGQIPKAVDGMKKLIQMPYLLATMERKWLLPLVASTIISIVLLLLATLSLGSRRHHEYPSNSVVTFLPARDSDQPQNVLEITEEEPAAGLPPPPRLAYLISGTKGDGLRMQRTLQALYHPRNYYLLHLDLEAPSRERVDLARYVKKEVVFQEAGNVYVVGKANLVTYRGPTMIAATLHGAAILLRQAKDWDWFINLSASDYPLVTQDGESHSACHSCLMQSLLSDIVWILCIGLFDFLLCMSREFGRDCCLALSVCYSSELLHSHLVVVTHLAISDFNYYLPNMLAKV